MQLYSMAQMEGKSVSCSALGPQDIRPLLQLGEPMPVTLSISQIVLLPCAHAPFARHRLLPTFCCII